MDRRTQRYIFLVVFFCVALVLYKSLGSGENAVRQSGVAQWAASSELDLRGLQAANSTLGFGAVVAVSREGSPRRESLLLASNITEIDITIPAQPQWTEDDLTHLRADRDSRISRGSALAWLGHLNALRWFLRTDLETMLILEDDVDWDIHLRTVQVPVAAAATRKLVADQTVPPGELGYQAGWNNFWGNSSAWDLLYLGHCGDIFRPNQWSPHVPRVQYTDKTLPPKREMHPYTTKFLESIGVGEYERLIHQSIFPLCTFAFAVTRNAAERLLTEVAPKEAEGGTMAYDVRILEGCRDLGMRCWSANPELFHHMDMESEIASAENRPLDEKVGADDSGRLKTLRIGKAPNIACGARSKEFVTQDPRTIAYLRQKVGREGKCLKDPAQQEDDRGPVTGDHYEGPGDPRMYI